ncbi:MAG: hypothetical protein ABIH23_18020, partial [bacterium]
MYSYRAAYGFEFWKQAARAMTFGLRCADFSCAGLLKAAVLAGLLCAVIACFPHLVYAQKWRNLGVYGGFVTDIGIDPFDSNHLIIGSYVVPYQSWDRGASWHAITDPNVEQFEGMQHTTAIRGQNVTFDGEIRGRVYVGGYGSDDGGETWRTIGENWSFNILAVHPENPDILFANAHCQNLLYRSPDRGETWQLVLSFPEEEMYIRSMAIDPETPNHIVVAVESHPALRHEGISGQLFESYDWGESFDVTLQGTLPGQGNGLINPCKVLFHNGSFYMLSCTGLYRRDGTEYVLLSKFSPHVPYGSSGFAISADGTFFLLDSEDYLPPPEMGEEVIYNTGDLNAIVGLIRRSHNEGENWTRTAVIEINGNNLVADRNTQGV